MVQFTATTPASPPPPQGYVACWRELAGDLTWSTEPDDRVRITTDAESEVWPVLLRRGTAGEPGSTYALADSTFTAGEITGAIDGHPGAPAGRAELTYRDRTRGRADVTVRAHQPYSLTTTSTIPELQWDASATDGAQPVVRGDLRLRWAGLSGELAMRDGRWTATVDVGGRGVWKPVFGLALLISRSRLQRALDQGLVDLTRDLERLIAGDRAADDRERSGPAVPDQGDHLPDLSVLNDLRFLRSPFSILRTARQLARQPSG